MKDLSLHILDIAENSIRAGATVIQIAVNESVATNWLILTITDNGKGMTEKMKNAVTHPFVTTRTLRKVGLGLPLLAQRCEMCEGDLQIESKEGKGTIIKAKMRYDHIDRVPIGDIGSTLMSLMIAQPVAEYVYQHHYNEKTFTVDTLMFKSILGDVPIQNMQVLLWIKDYINNHISLLCQENN